MKSFAISLSVVLLFMLANVVATRAQSGAAAPPPGVSAESWVPISDTAGIVLESDLTPAVSGSFGGPLGPPPMRATGTLMVRHNGRWLILESLGDDVPKFQQLH